MYATFLLFAYIALWSRIPCMVSDFTKDLDVIDFFAVLIATQLNSTFSGLYAAIFSVIVMMFSRIFGPDEDIMITLIESISFFIGSLLTPVIYHLTGHNLFLTLIFFTVQRYLYGMIIVIFFMRNLLFLATLSIFLGFPIAYIMNKITTLVFGPFLSSVFETGFAFNLPLFIFATILTILAHYLEPYMTKNVNILPKFNLDFRKFANSSEENHSIDDEEPENDITDNY